MRVGIVSKWFASGQAMVARQLRSALLELGHEPHVLVRPGAGPRAGVLEAGDDPAWAVEPIDRLSAHRAPAAEYADWAQRAGLDAVLLDENYEWEAIRALRDRGVRTVARFVWESFSAQHAAPAGEACDVIYSLTRAEQERYRDLGIESPYVHWGCHPELLAVADALDGPPDADDDLVRFYFPAGFLGRRKPIRAVVQAFSDTANPKLRLLIDAQLPRREKFLRQAARRDPRIELLTEDQPVADHLELMARCDVCVAPARWEGLGLPLYEALAFGMPIITNDKPPMSEVVAHERNGLLVGSIPCGQATSGVIAYDPDVDELTAAIERLADAGARAELRRGALEAGEQRDWSRTVSGLAGLLETAH